MPGPPPQVMAMEERSNTMKRSISFVLTLLVLGAASLLPAAAQASVTKNETVYAILDPTGAVKSVYVSDWLHSDKAGATIQDRSDLRNIENVKGKEMPSRSGSILTWKLSGQDVYYRGTSSKALPLSIKVSYFLDGKPIKPSALSGKSGNIRVVIDVKNLATGTIGSGADRRVAHAPFIVVVGMNLPVAAFSDIQVKGGKLLSDGQNNIVAGLLLPGVISDLQSGSSAKGLDSLGFKNIIIGQSFEFSAAVKNFTLGPIMLAATPDMPDIWKGGATAKVNGLLNSLDQLAAASTQIRDGSAALAQGASQLHAGIKTASDGVKPLFAKNDQFSPLFTFIGNDDDVAAARELITELKPLSDSMPALLGFAGEALNSENQAAIKKAIMDARAVDVKDLVGSPLVGSLVSEDSLSAMAESMKTSDDLYRSIDDKKLAALADSGSRAGALLSAEADFIGKTAFLDDSAKLAALEAKLGSGTALSAEENQQLLSLLKAAAENRNAAAGMSSQQTAGLAAGVTELARTAPRIIEVKKAYNKNKVAFDLARTFLAVKGKNGSFRDQLAKLQSLQEDLRKIEPLIAKGDEFINSDAGKAVLENTPMDAAKAQRLAADINRMRPLIDLSETLLAPESVAEMRAVSAKLPELESGLDQLESGSSLLSEKLAELAAGTAKFDEEGIKKLVGAGKTAGGLILNLAQTQDDLAKLSLSYSTFSGAPAGAQTSLKYILRTEEIH